MSNDNAPVPAGWYPSPDGGRRYWDGSTWLELPEPDTATPARRRHLTRKPVVLGLLVLALTGVGGTVAWKIDHDAQVAAQVTAAEEAAEREAQRLAAEQDAQERRDEAERAMRARSVAGIESSIETMAGEHVAEGMYDGPVLDVSCSPVNGGSTDNLTETTTVFECFVATEELGDGRMRGFKYHATMNWTSGEYTYGFGAP